MRTFQALTAQPLGVVGGWMWMGHLWPRGSAIEEEGSDVDLVVVVSGLLGLLVGALAVSVAAWACRVRGQPVSPPLNHDRPARPRAGPHAPEPLSPSQTAVTA